MMNKEMLESIEYLRERADVSYEEAEQLLGRFDGNVMKALVELERQGRVYAQPHDSGAEPAGSPRQESDPVEEGLKKAKSFFNNAMKNHLVVEKKEDGKPTKVVEVPVPLAVITAVAAPWLAVAAAGVGFATGYTAKVEKTEDEDDRA